MNNRVNSKLNISCIVDDNRCITSTNAESRLT